MQTTPVPEAHKAEGVLLVLGARDRRRYPVQAANLLQHAQHRLCRAHDPPEGAVVAAMHATKAEDASSWRCPDLAQVGKQRAQHNLLTWHVPVSDSFTAVVMHVAGSWY